MKILAVAEQRDGSLKKVAGEVMRAAASLASELNGEAVGLVIGDQVKSIAGSLGRYGLKRVLVADDPALKMTSTTAYAHCIAEAALKEKAEVVLFSATAQGKDLAPRVAVKLHAGLVADCTALNVEGGAIIASRPVYAGKALTDVKVTSPNKVFTLRPNVFSAGAPEESTAAVEPLALSMSDGGIPAIFAT